jgi:hypothetical protein
MILYIFVIPIPIFKLQDTLMNLYRESFFSLQGIPHVKSIGHDPENSTATFTQGWLLQTDQYTYSAR